MDGWIDTGVPAVAHPGCGLGFAGAAGQKSASGGKPQAKTSASAVRCRSPTRTSCFSISRAVYPIVQAAGRRLPRLPSLPTRSRRQASGTGQRRHSPCRRQASCDARLWSAADLQLPDGKELSTLATAFDAQHWQEPADADLLAALEAPGSPLAVAAAFSTSGQQAGADTKSPAEEEPPRSDGPPAAAQSAAAAAASAAQALAASSQGRPREVVTQPLEVCAAVPRRSHAAPLPLDGSDTQSLPNSKSVASRQRCVTASTAATDAEIETFDLSPKGSEATSYLSTASRGEANFGFAEWQLELFHGNADSGKAQEGEAPVAGPCRGGKDEGLRRRLLDLEHQVDFWKDRAENLERILEDTHMTGSSSGEEAGGDSISCTGSPPPSPSLMSLSSGSSSSGGLSTLMSPSAQSVFSLMTVY
eukprot:TRINITY_DN22303_c0_g1_i1.p1 TRINITY_DN22303_c0_g1~~TRINITY_DN22303_c0_g1_i1.p1  ORF type:complete len:418 (-),score=97.32 TRINITY_DN22303_c0_g1_i1:98-1351(-)